MDDTNGNLNQTSTQSNADSLTSVPPKPLMVTEPVISQPIVSTPGNENLEPQPKIESNTFTPNTNEPNAMQFSVGMPNTNGQTPEPNIAVAEPTVETPENTTAPITQQSVTPEEQQIAEPSFTFTSNEPVTVVGGDNNESNKNKSNAPFYLGLVALFLAVSIPLTVYLNQQIKTESEAKTNLTATTEASPSPKTNVTFFKPTLETSAKASISAKYKDMIVKNLAWINTQKTPENKYYLNEVYNNNQKMTDNMIDGRVGTYVLWLKYNYWKNTADSDILNSLTADLDALNKSATYQPDFWSCKLLYQMGIDSSLPPNIKDQTLSACKRAIFGSISFDLLTNPDKQNPIVEKEIDLTQVFNNSSVAPLPANQFGYQNYINFFINNSAVVSDYLAKAWWLDDGQFVLDATKAFNYAVGNYQSLNKIGNTPEACVLGIASLDMYTSIQENKYLDFAKALFDREAKNISLQSNPLAKINCLYFANQLNKIAPITEFEKYQTDLVNDILKTNYDAKTGFVFTTQNKITYRETKDTSLFSVYLINL